MFSKPKPVPFDDLSRPERRRILKSQRIHPKSARRRFKQGRKVPVAAYATTPN